MSGMSIIESRKRLIGDIRYKLGQKQEAEGGCGVLGIASSFPIHGTKLIQSLKQMRNRGNGKGGGIAIIGLSANNLKVNAEVLDKSYIIQIAYLDLSVVDELEQEFIFSQFDVHHKSYVETIEDHKSIGLEVKPPDVIRYFVSCKKALINNFIQENNISERDKAEDEFVYQNSYALHKKFYSSLGDKKAFVLSHGKDMLVFKIVGYAEQVIQYYKLDQIEGYIWIGHHRYPTKGVVWHPGGAHPFIGLNDTLVHNGDFSNYHGVAEYLAQFNVYPLFLTDTEVAAYLFDLYSRVFDYSNELIIEALAPTTERDFYMLKSDKQELYKKLQLSHINGSPDGPWFFIIGRSQPNNKHIQLLGITDTSMLRPQVFAMVEGNEGEKIGIVASERQAIDAVLESISLSHENMSSKADIYWNARGGSYTDGGAFVFDIDMSGISPKLSCYDKFNTEIVIPRKKETWNNFRNFLSKNYSNGNVIHPIKQFERILLNSKSLVDLLNSIKLESLSKPISKKSAIEFLTYLLDHLHLTTYNINGSIKEKIELTLYTIFRSYPSINEVNGENEGAYINFRNLKSLREPFGKEKFLVIDIKDFKPEGKDSASLFIVAAYKMGWRHIYSFDWKGHRFGGCGLGPNSAGFRLDVYGNPGDYLASGIDGAEIFVHTSAQDQVGQLFKSGKLIIYGDVGQAFMYGAKGGEVYVLGNAAGRPLINAVGRPRVVINGTCLDYLAESFMAGDPLKKGGFVILGGISFSSLGNPEMLDTPYSGGNLFSLSSGGAIYLHDPYSQVGEDQLHGGKFSIFTPEDEKAITPYLWQNETLFGINLAKISNGGQQLEKENYPQIFRKISPMSLKI
ncbi:MAG: GltB/FmdC/FwdC-like GXGXG domain-containing protein [Candidatus Hodarchaeales archaeon]|jgi:glutamate synthase domain-containing protein 1